MGPMLLATTIVAIVTTVAFFGFVMVMAADPEAAEHPFWRTLHVRISQSVRRSLLMPAGFLAFAIVGGVHPIGGFNVAFFQSTAAGPDLSQGGHMTEDMVTRVITQGGAVAVLLVVLWSYRRDFFRKVEDQKLEIQERRDREDTLLEVLDRSTTAITNSVNATTNQTRATDRLSKAVENIERKVNDRKGERRGADDTE